MSQSAGVGTPVLSNLLLGTAPDMCPAPADKPLPIATRTRASYDRCGVTGSRR